MTFPLYPMRPRMNPRTSVFSGMSREQLQSALERAQQALIELQTGAKIVSVSYAQGDGSRLVSYGQTNIAQLTQLIQSLQRQLGVPGVRRSALRPVF